MQIYQKILNIYIYLIFIFIYIYANNMFFIQQESEYIIDFYVIRK